MPDLRQPGPFFRLRAIYAVALALVQGAAWAGGSEPELEGRPSGPKRGRQSLARVEFSEQFLRHTGVDIDVGRFNHGNVALPGTYRSEVYVNEKRIGRWDVTLRRMHAGMDESEPCFDRNMLERAGVAIGKLSPEALALLADDTPGLCRPIDNLVPGATAAFDNNEVRLDISIPQVSMERQARGYVDPSLWDDGIPSARLQYTASAYRSQTSAFSSTESYVGLNAGLNAGPWRLRHNGSLSSGTRGTHYQSVQTYLQRAITPLRSQLTVGESFTDGTIFDPVGVLGVQITSDNRMYAESQRGYAPTVRGFAQSNALVRITQNGALLYESSVAPGAFEIDDLYATSYGGDLTVTVIEADGTKRVSVVPFAAAVNALRPGALRFGVAAGQYHGINQDARPALVQATVQYGLSNAVTGYGGAIVAEHYDSAVGGAALNTAYGAFGADVTFSWARLPGEERRNGRSMRLTYSKMVAPTRTNVTLAAYRYSSRGFLSLADTAALYDSRGRNLAWNQFQQRGRLQVAISQSLPEGYGSFYLTGSVQDYWGRRGRDSQYQAGYNNNWRRMTYGVSAARQLNVNARKWENRYMVTLTVPLGRGSHAPYSSTTWQRDSGHGISLQESLTGSIGKDYAFTYGLNAGYARDAGVVNRSIAGNIAYAAPMANFTASASRSRDYTQYSAGMSGGLVAYAGGVAFTSSMGETMAVIEADGAQGARVLSANGLRLDPWGRAVVSNLMPFSRNPLEIDPTGLPLNVEMKSTVEQAVPSAGALVRVRFDARNAGTTAMLRAALDDGKPLPFGAQVFDGLGTPVGSVAQGGRAVVRGLRASAGELTVKWGAGKSCTLHYRLSEAVGKRGVRPMESVGACERKPAAAGTPVEIADKQPRAPLPASPAGAS